MLQERITPANIREDAKIGKIIPTKSLVYFVIAFIIGILMFISVFRNSIFIGLILTLAIPVAVLLIHAFDIPGNIGKVLNWLVSTVSTNKLDELLMIDNFETVSATKDGRERIYLEKNSKPWNVCPDAIKESNALEFATQVYSTLRDGCSVTVFCTTAPESTAQLEARLAKLPHLSPGLRKLENERIELHYQLSKRAHSSRYVIRIESGEFEKDVSVAEAAENFEGNCCILGGDIVKELVYNHLTSCARATRGKDGEQSDTRTKWHLAAKISKMLEVANQLTHKRVTAIKAKEKETVNEIKIQQEEVKPMTRMVRGKR